MRSRWRCLRSCSLWTPPRWCGTLVVGSLVAFRQELHVIRDCEVGVFQVPGYVEVTEFPELLRRGSVDPLYFLYGAKGIELFWRPIHCQA